MPTAYTAPIEDDPAFTFEQYLMRCARAMGACFSQRDESMDAPPRPAEVGDYHQRGIEAAQARLVELNKTSDVAMERRAAAHHKAALTSWRESVERNTSERAAYDRMLEQVEAWIPPTEDHEGLKKFMREQIELCRFDYEPSRPEPLTGQQYREQMVGSANRDLDYHREHLAMEQRRVEESREWIAALTASIGASA